MAEGWMTALQAVDKGQAVVHSSMLERVYNLCLEGGGNILINTSSQPEVMIFTPAATMGYLFTPASGSQQYNSLSYPEDIQTKLGLRQDLSYGLAHFRHAAVKTLPNGGLIFDNTTGDMPQKKTRAPLLDKCLGDNPLKQPAPPLSTAMNKKQNSGATAHDNREKLTLAPSDASPLCSRSTDFYGDPVRLNQGTSQPKSNTAKSTKELESRSVFANTILHSPRNRCSNSIVLSHSTAETFPTQAAGQEYRLTPSFTSDTHILLLTAGVASWTPIRDARWGATVIQSLPYGNVGDVRRAQLATLEKVWFFEEEGDDIIVQIGKAHLTANHPIHTAEGWLLASQAAARGYGLLSSVREFSQLCGLQLATGGNILINTSTTHDLASVYIEAATLGYSFLSSPEPLNGNFPTYAVQMTGPRHGSAGPTKPSYSQVTTLHHKGVSKRPIPLFTPETHASPKVIAVRDETAKGHTGEPTTGISALGALTAQRKPEECSGDLDAARAGPHEIKPTGNQESSRVVMQGDGPGGADEGHEAVRRAQDNRDGSTGNATAARITGPTLPRLPASSSAGLNKEQTIQGLIKCIMHDDSLSHPEKSSRVQAIWAGKRDRGGSDETAADVHSQRDTTDTTNTTCHATPFNVSYSSC